MNVRDVISPLAYSWAQLLGYAVFAISWIFVLLAFTRALLDAVTHQRYASRVRRAPVCKAAVVVRCGTKSLVFPVALDVKKIFREVTRG